MIGYRKRLPPLAEPFFGAQTETLYVCYREFPMAFSLYRAGTCGTLCRFGERLLLCGTADPTELAELVPFLGVTRVEGAADALPVFEGWTRTEQGILRGDAVPHFVTDGRIDCNPDPRRVFELLCAADATFAAQAQVLPWLSDLATRRRHGRARLYLTADGAATVTVTAIGMGHALLSLVACDPARQGHGHASALVAQVAAELTDEGLRPFVAAQSVSLEGFYRRLGFVSAGRQAIVQKERQRG